MILDSYAAFLSSRQIPFYTKDGFSVSIGRVMINVSVTDVVTLSAYIGLVNAGIRAAKHLVRELERLYPGYKIWPEWYSGYYEIEVEKSFSCTSASALHEYVVAMAEMLEAGYETGKGQLGENFCR